MTKMDGKKKDLVNYANDYNRTFENGPTEIPHIICRANLP